MKELNLENTINTIDKHSEGLIIYKPGMSDYVNIEYRLECGYSWRIDTLKVDKLIEFLTTK